MNQVEAGFLVELKSNSCIKYFLQVMAGAYCILSSGNGTNNFYVDFSSFYLGVQPSTAIRACTVCGYTLVVNCLVALFSQVSDSFQRSTSDLALQASCNNIDFLWNSLLAREALNLTYAGPLFQTYFKINRFNFVGSDFESSFQLIQNLHNSLNGRRLISATFGFQFKVFGNGTDPWTTGVNSKLSFAGVGRQWAGVVGVMMAMLEVDWRTW